MSKNYSKIKIFCYLLFVSGFFIWPNSSLGEQKPLLITQVQIAGEKTNHDFIEIYNLLDINLNLGDYKLRKKTKTGKEYSIKSFSVDNIIPANSYYLWACSKEDYSEILSADVATTQIIATNNSIAIIDAEGKIVDALAWGENLENPFVVGSPFPINPEVYQSIQRKKNSDSAYRDTNSNTDDFEINLNPQPKSSSYQIESSSKEPLTEEPSAEEPGTEDWTPTTLPNRPPTANAGTDITALVNQEIIFDGSLSSDPNNDALTYFWNFGDGATDTEQAPKHTYLYPGQYIASLLVDDGEFSDLDIITVNIYNQSVIISEFMPNPEGVDTENEWIELFNQSSQIANLSNWQLDDQDGGSSPFIFPANSLIAPNQFLVLIRPITKISLNNDNDQVRLFYPDGSLSAEVGYLAEKKQGFSIAFDGSDYFWTKIPTPGSANIISSSKSNTKEENLSANNPEPVIQQTQDMPENTVSVNLNQSQSFSALNAPAENIENLKDEKIALIQENNQEASDLQPSQTASLAQSAQSNQKSKLILYLSIIISASLFASWGLIMFSRRKVI